MAGAKRRHRIFFFVTRPSAIHRSDVSEVFPGLPGIVASCSRVCW